MTNKIQHLALNSLPTTIPDAGSIIYLSNGSQYVTTSNGTYIKFSDLVFTDKLDTFGTVEKLYIHNENGKSKLKVWNGISYGELLSGEEFDSSQLESDITQLQSDLATLQGKITTTESKITTNEGKISTLETKINEIESQSGNVDLSALEIKVESIESNVNNNTLNINNLTTQLSHVPSQITNLDTRLDEIEDKKKSSTIVFSTNDISVGEKPTIVDVPYTSKVTSMKTILTNDSGSQVDYSIEKSTDGASWSNIAGGNVSVGSLISTSPSSTTLSKNELLRLVVNSDNEDVLGLTVNITIEEQ